MSEAGDDPGAAASPEAKLEAKPETARLFLDANVLFSAAYREDSGLRSLWQLPGTILVSSSYAIAEATRNLSTPEQHARLEGLLKAVLISNLPAPAAAQEVEIEGAGLPEKDLPIMDAAVGSRCTHLITGDGKHFGHLFGEKVAGVLITRPADHLAQAAR